MYATTCCVNVHVTGLTTYLSQEYTSELFILYVEICSMYTREFCSGHSHLIRSERPKKAMAAGSAVLGEVRIME